MSDEHSSPIKNWKQLLVVVHLALLIPVVLIIIVTQLLTGHLKGPTPEGAKAVVSRIKPVGEVVMAPAGMGANAASMPAAAVSPTNGTASDAITLGNMRNSALFAPSTLAAASPAVPAPGTLAGAPGAAAATKPDGKMIYDTTCMVCHATGVAGAPKFGDKEAWAPRIKTGVDTLHASALKGKGAMPPKGGNAALSDAEVIAAVDYTLSAAK